MSTTPEVAGRMSFFDHLGELRKRLIWSVVVLFALTVVCFEYSPELFEWLRTPLLALPAQKLIVLSPLELYVTYLKLAVMAALFLGAPFVLGQIWLFVGPGLYGHEKRWIVPFVVLGSLFFIGGGAFAFYVVLPMGFHYVVAMMPETISPTYSVELYFSLVVNMMLAFGLVFELPLIMWILSASGLVNPATYTRIRRYWIVTAFIVAAILTPPDPFTQTLMAIPLLIFFELGVMGGKILYKKRRSVVRDATTTA